MPHDMILSPQGRQRRNLLKGAAAVTAGLLFGFELPLDSRLAKAAGTPAAVGAWVRIASDESVTILVGSTEMGQGAMTGLAQLLNEELMADWAKVSAEHAPADPVYANPGMGGQMTAGSSSIRGYYEAMQNAGAMVREMLKRAAVNAFGPTATSCTTANGVVTVSGGGVTKTYTYGQLAPSANGLQPYVNPPPRLGTGKFIGKSMARLDIPSKVDGSAVYGVDVRVPGMLHASVKQCPTIGGTVASIGSKPSSATQVLNLGNAVVVVAKTTGTAIKAARSLSVTWNLPANAAQMDSVAITAKATTLMASGTGAVAEGNVANATTAYNGAAKKLEFNYDVPYLAHACMEPLACTASVTLTNGVPTSCEVWAATQAQSWTAATAAAITGIADPTRITVHTTFLGGGLGRKIEQDYIAHAITASKMLGVPVKVVWSREEDFGHDQYRPMALSRVRVGLDASNNIVSWSNRIVSPSIIYQRWPQFMPNGVDSQSIEGATALPYKLGTTAVEYIRHDSPIPVGFWRSVGHSINAFVVESAIDQAALAANIDPLTFRQKLLANSPRHLAVLNAAAALGGWTTKVPSGRARGIALAESFGTIVAQVVEISGTATSIKVNKVACVVDAGKIVNPDQVTAQMQGGIVHGLAAALWGKITFTNGVSTVTNFNKYRMLRMSDMPAVTVQILSSTLPPSGCGEPGVPPIAPAVANAYARLPTVGKRLTSLPFFPAASTMGD